MEIMSIILEAVIIVEVLAIVILATKKLKQQPKNEKLASTERMVKNILLNNKWENIDDVIGTLKRDSIHINYKLR